MTHGDIEYIVMKHEQEEPYGPWKSRVIRRRVFRDVPSYRVPRGTSVTIKRGQGTTLKEHVFEFYPYATEP